MPRKKRGRKAQQTVGLYCRIQIGQTCQNFVRCVSRKRHWGQDGNWIRKNVIIGQHCWNEKKKKNSRNLFKILFCSTLGCPHSVAKRAYLSVLAIQFKLTRYGQKCERHFGSLLGQNELRKIQAKEFRRL